MPTHEILLVPSSGYTSLEGGYTRGHVVDGLAEIDLVDQYVRAICDSLDDAGVRHRVMPVRKPPGVQTGRRHSHILDGTFVISCSVGWSVKPPSKSPLVNSSRVFFAKHEANGLAVLLAETISHWGHLYVSHEHRACKPAIDDDDLLLKVPSGGIRIEPFLMNGPNLPIYAQRLEQLGRDIGRTIADHLILERSVARIRPSTLSTSVSR